MEKKRVEVGGSSGEKTGWGDDRRNDREREGEILRGERS